MGMKNNNRPCVDQDQGVNYGPRDIALANEILRSIVGSGVHGIAVQGTDDHDEMGVFVEPRDHVYGAKPALDQHVWRTRGEGERSRPGDTDLVIYSLRKYLRLATKGNPTALLPLFAPESDVLVLTEVGSSLRALRGAFVSQDAVRRFLGYLRRQHAHMFAGGSGRPELVERYGWDTKFGAHALRLALQGWELASTGRLTLPLPANERSLVLSVKQGGVGRDEVSALIVDHSRRTAALLDSGRCTLPVTARIEDIERWSIRAHEHHWFASDRLTNRRGLPETGNRCDITKS
jgi:hypothetical protein